MARYLLTLDDDHHEEIDADTYVLEGPLTTFFQTRGGSTVVDSWAVRLASYRTANVLAVRRLVDVADGREPSQVYELRSA